MHGECKLCILMYKTLIFKSLPIPLRSSYLLTPFVTLAAEPASLNIYYVGETVNSEVFVHCIKFLLTMKKMQLLYNCFDPVQYSG